MKEKIHKYFNRYVEFNRDEINEFCSKIKIKTFDKKEYILKEGQICNNRYFILEGLVRSFYTDYKGNEKIIQFALENWWITDTDSFINQIPSFSSIQTLEKTTVLILNKKDLETLYFSNTKLERLFRMISEKTLIAIQRKANFYLQMNSKDRYNLFTTQFPIFAQRVPQYMIASYLEITPEYLSEIRSK
ncbi:Crp/Fnr family transcriptional regulator [Maribacter sp. HS]|uniref:Crp/Fnr family transcriptional regulator n=1 Tax=Maribacter sp. HS TaxID=3110480 RepID=UPI003A88A9BD